MNEFSAPSAAPTTATPSAHAVVEPDELLAELGRLEQAEARVSAVRRRLHDQIDLGYPTEQTRAYERQLSDERRALQRRIDALRAEFAPARGRTR